MFLDMSINTPTGYYNKGGRKPGKALNVFCPRSASTNQAEAKIGSLLLNRSSRIEVQCETVDLDLPLKTVAVRSYCTNTAASALY